MSSFTEHLREKSHPLFQAVREHPFVQGIANGELTSPKLMHYVSQDYQYLNTYAQVYGLGLAKCRNRDEMQKLYERIGVVLNGEIHPHLNLCEVAGVDYKTLQVGTVLAPTAHHYARHMISTAQTGTLGELLAVILPCHWMYVDIGEFITNTKEPSEAHPFYPWISFYNSPIMHESLHELTKWLDQYAESAGPFEKARMEQAFLTSCHMEIRFFEMAYTLETW